MIELYGRPAGPLTRGRRDPAARSESAAAGRALSPSATGEADRFVLAAEIPLSSLAPGDYIVRAIVGLQGQEGHVTHTLRKAGGS